ncbi:hypothetical protein YPPY32_2464, partial [Yersinia pestis PY-32]
MLALGVIGGGR